MSSNRSRSVRFAEGNDDERPKKRPRSLEDDDDSDPPPPQDKSKKKDRINEDEMDDVDDWEDDEEHVEGVASEKERLEAKRVRRAQREQGESPEKDNNNNNRESTRINDATSLATEGVEIEPFHMDNERTDGTGYFDGDTYVFRKRNVDEEPDAWLESLDKDGEKATGKTGRPSFFTESSSDSEPDASKEQVKSKEEWYAKIIPLVTGTETIMQAVVRYGQLLKRQPLKHRKGKDKAAKKESEEKTVNQSESFTYAQNSLNDLTEAANALLGLGDVDIYQKTKSDLLKLIPQKEDKAKGQEKAVAKENPSSPNAVSWEYKGSQDHQIHGPYTGEQMKAWIRAGYFVGAQAVQIRSIRAKEKSNVDDMLSDLMDDDEDEGASKEVEYVRGEWQASDKVDYDAAT